jgi:hypothetical protein
MSQLHQPLIEKSVEQHSEHRISPLDHSPFVEHHFLVPVFETGPPHHQPVQRDITVSTDDTFTIAVRTDVPRRVATLATTKASATPNLGLS